MISRPDYSLYYAAMRKSLNFLSLNFFVYKMRTTALYPTYSQADCEAHEKSIVKLQGYKAQLLLVCN